MAIKQHNTTNLHHPESWLGGIKEMPRVYLGEFICDIKARANEFGTSVREWFEESATVKFGFTKEDEVYKDCIYFLDLLCDKPFVPITKIEKDLEKVA